MLQHKQNFPSSLFVSPFFLNNMLQAFLDSITKPSELAALYKYKFAPKSSSARRLQQTLAKDASKKRCYDFLNMVRRETAACWTFCLFADFKGENQLFIYTH